MNMPESLSDMFAEAMDSDDSVEIVAVDEPDFDNPDTDGADYEDEDASQGDEIEEDDEDTDLDDEESDDEPSADTDDFDWNNFLQEHGDRTVTLTVQGEPVEVKISDLPNGFMMREDYSRKTAEVAEVRKAATWAQDVQAAFANDPVGTIQAFAQAYGIQVPLPGQSDPASEVDPYEDLDPDVAAVLRKMDEQESRHQAELSRVREQVSQFQNQQIMEDVKAEVRGLREEFGDELDAAEMLRIAAFHNMPLREAAEVVVGRQYFAKSKEQLALEAQAKEAGERRSGQVRERSKKRASGTATRKFDASDVSVEDFDTISDLFEIELNSTS